MSEGQEATKEEKEKCFVGDEEVLCPGEGGSLSQTREGRLIPAGLVKDERGDRVFFSALIGVAVVALVLIILKIRVFGRTLTEYVKPIRLYILGAALVVLSQYLIGLPYSEELPHFIKITQGMWALAVALSVMKLSKEENFNLGNAVFLGVIYSVVIHGLKVTIRYLFYGKTLFYVADRFVYGSLLVMLIVIILGPFFLFLKNKGVRY